MQVKIKFNPLKAMVLDNCEHEDSFSCEEKTSSTGRKIHNLSGFSLLTVVYFPPRPQPL